MTQLSKEATISTAVMLEQRRKGKTKYYLKLMNELLTSWSGSNLCTYLQKIIP